MDKIILFFEPVFSIFDKLKYQHIAYLISAMLLCYLLYQIPGWATRIKTYYLLPENIEKREKKRIAKEKFYLQKKELKIKEKLKKDEYNKFLIRTKEKHEADKYKCPACGGQLIKVSDGINKPLLLIGILSTLICILGIFIIPFAFIGSKKVICCNCNYQRDHL